MSILNYYSIQTHLFGLALLAVLVLPLNSQAQDNVNTNLDMRSSEGMAELCRFGFYGEGDDVAKLEASSFCIGRLSGLATAMMYNCIAIKDSKRVQEVLEQEGLSNLIAMGGYTSGEQLVSSFLGFVDENTVRRSDAWGFSALRAFAQDFPCLG